MLHAPIKARLRGSALYLLLMLAIGCISLWQLGQVVASSEVEHKPTQVEIAQEAAAQDLDLNAPPVIGEWAKEKASVLAHRRNQLKACGKSGWLLNLSLTLLLCGCTVYCPADKLEVAKYLLTLLYGTGCLVMVFAYWLDIKEWLLMPLGPLAVWSALASGLLGIVLLAAIWWDFFRPSRSSAVENPQSHS